jgi:integrase
VSRSAPPSPGETPTFADFADEWWQLKRREIGEGTQDDYRRRLEVHLLPYFEDTLLDEIRADAVDRYKAAKLAKGLAPRTVNMHLVLLSAILESAVERELIDRNPAAGRRRRVKERKPQRSYLDTDAQIRALLEAAGELDREAPEGRKHVHRKAMLAFLAFAGVRLGELLDLRWREVDLPAGRLTVQGTKTDQAKRTIRIRGALRDELVAVRAQSSVHTENPDAYVFPTLTGRRFGTENFRNRVFAGAVKRGNLKLSAAGRPPLPEGLTPHSLRRTFASLLYATGESPVTVKREMGHADEGLALRIYAQVMERDEGDRAKLKALIEGAEFMSIDVDGGSSTGTEAPTADIEAGEKT